MQKNTLILIVSVLVVSICFSQNIHLDYDKSISELIKNVDQDSVSILIEKSEYKLTILYNNRRIKSYPVVFGSNSIDDKLRQGDCCTPEGLFKVRDHYTHKSWSKFIWIDYPTATTWEKHNSAKVEGVIPQSASIGGEIGIHGVPDGYDHMIDERYNWTLGCISLKNADVNEIYRIIKNGTEIEIRH